MTALSEWIAAQRALEQSRTRPWVDAFSDEMERKLSLNRHKGDRDGWIGMDPIDLMDMLKAEVVELEYAKPDEVLAEAADVANFAMMIADVAGGMKPRVTVPTALRLVEVLMEAHRRISGMSPCDGPQANESLSALAECERIVGAERTKEANGD